MPERTIVKFEDAFITSHRVVCGGKTFASAHITSVEVLLDKRIQYIGFVILILGIVIVASGIPQGTPATIVAGLVFALVGILAICFGIKRGVRFYMSSSQHLDLAVPTEEAMRRIASAISEAIIAERG